MLSGLFNKLVGGPAPDELALTELGPLAMLGRVGLEIRELSAVCAGIRGLCEGRAGTVPVVDRRGRACVFAGAFIVMLRV